MRFVKKPIEIEAIQYNGENKNEIIYFSNGSIYLDDRDYFFIKTLEGQMKVIKGDWIIKGIKNEFYPCKNDIFELTYDKVVR